MDIEELNVELHEQTDKARLVSITGYKTDAKWVAKSQTEFWGLDPNPTDEQKRLNLIHIIAIPDWIALKNGWI